MVGSSTWDSRWDWWLILAASLPGSGSSQINGSDNNGDIKGGGGHKSGIHCCEAIVKIV